ncbi:MAG: HEPN domain-containing protein, partial [Victivallaceae bacterium]|nr:HEPN domain-containing protein [Victivallaceae bacterium]
LREGHYFFSDIKKEGILLYDSGKCKLERKRRIDPARRLEIATEDFAQWFESANEFLDTTFDDVKKKRYKKAAFELHQAMKRFYKAAILTHTGYIPRTHDIEKLGQVIARDYPEFLKIFPQKTQKEQDLFKKLKKAYVDARYKKDYSITKDELVRLAKRVEKLRDLVEETCRNIIKDLSSEVRAEPKKHV